jgi:tRNA modification GTPase
MMEETSIACLTPPGRGAIATLAIRGPAALPVVRELFQPLSKPLPALPEPSSFWLGRLGEINQAGSVEVVLVVRSPNHVELHCHGGHEIVRLIQEVFAKRGIQVCSWQDQENKNGQTSLRNLAMASLAQATTVRTAAILLDQYHGAFSTALEKISRNLSGPEGICELDELASRIPLGRHLLHPWHVVIAGAANVGKSSLVNALAGFQRSVVASTPGTTRDVVTTFLAIDGWPVELADTAGRRSQSDSLEEEGVARARTAADNADLCLWLLDGSTTPIYPESRTANLRLVINKVDLPAAWVWDEVDAVRVSAKTGAGLNELCQHLSRWLVPNPPSPGAAVPFTPDLCDQVEEARQLCSQGKIVVAIERLSLVERNLFRSAAGTE